MPSIEPTRPDEALDDYIAAHIDPEPKALKQIARLTGQRMLYPHMCSGHVQGRVLKMLVRMIRPHRVLELGTYSGYSAMCLAEGLASDDDTVDTVEINDEHEDFIRHSFSLAPWGKRIRLHIGDAASVVPQLGLTFDMAFIDANKREYCEYYKLVMPHVRPGGFLVADNTLWDGKVATAAAGGKVDAQTRGIAQFNDLVAADAAVERVILPVRDGLTIIHKLH